MAIILDDHNVRFLTPPISPVSNWSAISLVPMFPALTRHSPHIIQLVMHFDILPSPTPAIALSQYDKASFPIFDRLFETPSPSSPLFRIARAPQEAEVAVVIENRAEKAITAWRFRWQLTDSLGNQRPVTMSSDSYTVDVFRPVAEPASRHLITPSGCVSQTSLEHIQSGGGFVGGSVRSTSSFSELADVTFEIHLVVFIDGEIAGRDPDDFAIELQGRKRAAEFVARQIRMAQAEGRDVTPVLTALVEAPVLGSLGRPQGEPLFHSVRDYARDYLQHMHRKIGGINLSEARLYHLETRPELPKFYRRSESVK
jgi:hypothetical protein